MKNTPVYKPRKRYALCDIPNQTGFRLTGIDENNEKLPCIVKKNAIGCHSLYDERTGEPIFFRLIAWEKID